MNVSEALTVFSGPDVMTSGADVRPEVPEPRDRVGIKIPRSRALMEGPHSGATLTSASDAVDGSPPPLQIYCG